MSNYQVRQFFYKKSRIQQFTGFCTVIQTGTILEAAKKMFLDPSTISVQIKALEDDLKIKLFKRTKQHRLIPTKEGLALYKKLVPIVQNVEGILGEFLSEIKDKNNKDIRIAGHHVAISHILSKYIGQFSNDFPETKFILNNISREEAYRSLIDDEIDMAIYPIETGTEIPEEIECLKAFNYDLVLIMYKDHPLAKKPDKEITRKDIVNYNFIHMDKKMMTANTFVRLFQQLKVKNNIVMKNGSWEITKELVKQKIGISGMSKLYIKKEDNLVTKSITHILPDLTYCIFLKKNGFIKEKSRKFLELLKENFNFKN